MILASALSACGQDISDTTNIELVRTVMEHRLIWMQDSTQYNACRIHEQLGRPDNLSARLGPLGSRLLNQLDNPCAAPRPKGPVINLMSVTVEDSIGRVILFIIRGEFGHEEEYMLRMTPGGPPWAIEEVRLTGWTHYNPPPRLSPPLKERLEVRS
jgi:hypothetical protein